jgi:hypothetical protein
MIGPGNDRSGREGGIHQVPRVKPHAKIQVNLRNHRKTAAIFEDNDLLASYTRALLLAVQRYADKTNDSFIASNSDIAIITAASNNGAGIRRMRRLCDVARQAAELGPIGDRDGTEGEPPDNRPAIAMQPHGNQWLIAIHNFAERQGFRPRNGERMGRPTTTTPTTTTTKTTNTSRSEIAVPPEGEPVKAPETQKGQRSVAKSKELALEVWPELVERVASYGKTWFSKPQGKQLEMLTMRIRKGATRVQLLAAIDGFAALHGDRLEDPDNPMRKYFRATTIYQASKFEEYLEAEADMSAPDARKARRDSDAEDILNKLNNYSEDDDGE